MKSKSIKYHEIKIMFIIPEKSYGAKSKKELLENIFRGIGGNDMGYIEAQEIEIAIDGKVELKAEEKE